MQKQFGDLYRDAREPLIGHNLHVYPGTLLKLCHTLGVESSAELLLEHRRERCTLISESKMRIYHISRMQSVKMSA